MATQTAPTTVRIETFPQQEAFIFCKAPWSAAITGISGGKTQGGSIRLGLYMNDHPGARVCVTAPTYRQLQDTTLKTFQEVWPRDIYTWQVGEMILTWHNGSEALFRVSSEPDKLRGLTLAAFWMDEAAIGEVSNPDTQFEAFQILQGRLRQAGYPQQGWVTTTPQGYNWIWREFVKEKRAGWEVFRWPTRDNPYLPKNYLTNLAATYQGAFALQELEGEFVVLAGSAYFNIASLATMEGFCREPLEKTDLVSVWKLPHATGRYIAFADVAWGHTGAYSCLVVADWATLEQVAEVYGRPTLDEYTKAIYEACQRYNKAYLGVEANGEGQTVVNNLVDMSYGPRMHHRGDKWATVPTQRGWLTTGGPAGSRLLMLGDLQQAVDRVQFMPRCREAIGEMRAFIRDDKGIPGPSHGIPADHVMAWAGLVQMRGAATWAAANYEPAYRGRRW